MLVKMKNSETKKPNIVFILTDDQRYDTINALGYHQIKTPNMDKLVHQGTSFTNAYIPCGTCPGVCMPSRAMIHSGKSLFHLKDSGAYIPKKHVTMGEVLRENGYRTYGIGKWHNGTESFQRSFEDGDNIFFGGMWDHWNVPVNHYDPTGRYDNMINFTENFAYNNDTIKVHCDCIQPGVHSSEFITDTAIRYLDSAKEDAPFFLYVAYLAPHDPRTMPERFKQMYSADEIELPLNFMGQHPFDYGVNKIRAEQLKGVSFPRKEEEIRKNLAEYYGMISHLDFQIGRILDTLEKNNQVENTIIILAGDNGLALGSHGLMAKQNAYEHSVKVPCVLKGKGIAKDRIVDQQIYLMDIYPTIMELIGVNVPDNLDGISFAKMLQNVDCVTREYLYFGYTHLLRSVKNKKYKWIEYRNVARETQLFDLENDPYEMNNLAGNSSYHEIIEQFRKKMFEFKEEWDDDQEKFGGRFYSDF